MSDVNYAHCYVPRSKDGKCKVIVGGRRRGYQICGLMGDAEVHTRFKAPPPPKWHHGQLSVVTLGEMGDHYKLAIHCQECNETFHAKLEILP